MGWMEQVAKAYSLILFAGSFSADLFQDLCEASPEFLMLLDSSCPPPF